MNPVQRAAAALFAGVLTLSVGIAANAQQQQAQQGGRGRGRGMQVTLPEAWAARLKLNADQTAKIKAAEDAYRQTLQGAQTLQGQDRRTATMKAGEDYKAAVNTTLNDDQKKQLEAMRAEAAEYRGLGFIASQLVGMELTAEQKTKVKELSTKYQAEGDKLREEARASMDRQAAGQKMREMNMKAFEEVKAVLTPEQQKNLRQPGPRRPNTTTTNNANA
jgi:Spy/CpxP family protein refolding chaperone